MMFIIPHDAFLDFSLHLPLGHPLILSSLILKTPLISAPILTRLNTA